MQSNPCSSCIVCFAECLGSVDFALFRIEYLSMNTKTVAALPRGNVRLSLGP